MRPRERRGVGTAGLTDPHMNGVCHWSNNETGRVEEREGSGRGSEKGLPGERVGKEGFAVEVVVTVVVVHIEVVKLSQSVIWKCHGRERARALGGGLGWRTSGQGGLGCSGERRGHLTGLGADNIEVHTDDELVKVKGRRSRRQSQGAEVGSDQGPGGDVKRLDVVQGQGGRESEACRCILP